MPKLHTLLHTPALIFVYVLVYICDIVKELEYQDFFLDAKTRKKNGEILGKTKAYGFKQKQYQMCHEAEVEVN